MAVAAGAEEEVVVEAKEVVVVVVAEEALSLKMGATARLAGRFHGKSTIVQALQFGCPTKNIWGRKGILPDFAKCDDNSSKDERCVTSVDISPFINNLPFGKDMTGFGTPCSRSEASNIVESIEAGADTLLIDEEQLPTTW